MARIVTAYVDEATPFVTYVCDGCGHLVAEVHYEIVPKIHEYADCPCTLKKEEEEVPA